MDKQTGVALMLMFLAVPLMLKLVPRNWLYGFRTPRTMASDEVWYPANQVCGVTLLIAGAIWFFWGMPAGLTALIVGIVVSFASLFVILKAR